MSFARASPFPWKVFQGGRPSVARPMLFVKELLSLPLECCDHQGDGVAEFTAASLFHLYQFGRDLGCGIGQGRGVEGEKGSGRSLPQV